MQVLDRVLKRKVDVVDHRRQGRRLARTGGAGDEDVPPLLLGQVGDDRRQPQLLHRADFEGNRAADDRGGAALLEDVDAEAGEAGYAYKKSASPTCSNSVSERTSVMLWKAFSASLPLCGSWPSRGRARRAAESSVEPPPSRAGRSPLARRACAALSRSRTSWLLLARSAQP